MTRSLIASVVALSLLAPFAACKKTPAEVATAPKAMDNKAVPAPVPQAVVTEIAANFARVHFGFDSAALDKVSRDALNRNAQLLQAHPAVRVEIQGHADERGTTDYNLALGDRRANAVRDHLMISGVSGSRLTAVSFGEERPLASGKGETAWSQNRRAEFRITVADGARVSGTTDR